MTSRMTHLSLAIAGLSLFASPFIAIASANANAEVSVRKSQTALSLSTVQANIDAAHAGWTAGESTVSRMSENERAALLGLRGEEAPDLVFDNGLSQDDTSTLAPRSSSATSFDWRSHNGANWVSPILDQGKCGSCVAFASIGVLETQMKIESGYSGYNVKLSPQYLFSCGGASCSWGWLPGNAARYLQNYGTTDESCMPYASQSGKSESCRRACGDAESRRVRITSFTEPTNSELNIAAIKAALKNGPLVTTMNVYADFMYYAGGVYKHVSGKREGSHAISIVGYDDNERSLIMRNSWGPDWGELGFAHISYDDISGLGNSTWQYQVNAFKGISLNSPTDGDYASGSLTISTHSTENGTAKVRVNIYNSANQVALTQVLSGSKLNIANLADGRYEIEVQALNRASETLATSQRHGFYVSAPNQTVAQGSTGGPHTLAVQQNLFTTQNQNLQLALKSENMSHAMTTDQAYLARTKTLRVSANVGNKEVTHAAFHFRKLGDAEKSGEVVRTSNHLRDGATLTWKTDALAAGQYEYWITGEISGQVDGAPLSAHSESAHQTMTLN